MINILPTEEKKKNLIEYNLRLGVVGVFAVAALVLSSLVLLAPSYLLAVSKLETVSAEHAALEVKQGRAVQEKDVNTQITSINKKIALLVAGSTGVSLPPSQMISSIIKLKTDAIKIHGFTYDASIGKGRIVIVGKASDRDSLARFVEILKKEPTFTNVDIPISSYVKSTDIDFSIVIERGLKK